MNAGTEKDSRKKQSSRSPQRRDPAGHEQQPVHSQAVSPCDDLQARIARRAYEIHVERGYRYGYALEDWLAAEREILASEAFT